MTLGDIIPVIDVTFVDDEAVTFTAASPATLDHHLRLPVSCLSDILSCFGFSINWKMGKTEVIVKYRGRHASNRQ